MIKSKLEHVRHYLPSQGPLKDFIHHNTLHAFQNMEFEEALCAASQCYETNKYMPLSYYRLAHQTGKISDAELEKAIARGANRLEMSVQVLTKVIHEWREIQDKKTLEFLVKKHGLQNQRRSEFVEKAHKERLFSKIRLACSEQIQVDWDTQINPILFRIVSAFLDQGITLWQFPARDDAFIEALKQLMNDSKLGIAAFVHRERVLCMLQKSAEEIVATLLDKIVGDHAFVETYMRETLMVHPGWSGMVSVIESKPSSLLRSRRITLMEFLAFKLILEWEFIQARCPSFVSAAKWRAYHPEKSNGEESDATERFSAIWFNLLHDEHRLDKPIELFALQSVWHEAFERTSHRKILGALTAQKEAMLESSLPKSMQAIFCIDDRECSFRRYLEEIDPSIETFGWAGFFGMDFFFQSLNDAVPVQMCPPIITPKYLVKEFPKEGHEPEFLRQKAKMQKTAVSFELWREASSSLFLGFLAASTLGHVTLFRLIGSMLRPKQFIDALRSRRINVPTVVSLLRSDESAEGDVLHGFTHEEMIQRVESVLRGMGLTRDFAPIVFVVAHGSSSVNNPHFAAYDCGACSGKPGAPNARAIAHMANLPEVRKGLLKRAIAIPDETVFVGGYHDTATDLVTLFDTDQISKKHQEEVQLFLGHCAEARKRNAKERCRRFALTDLEISGEEAVHEVVHRTMALFEPRPELGHATNMACIVGRRSLTRGLFLDRRSFLNSYDPTQDPDGQVLAQVLNAAIPVCGGINLEYFFSRVDSARYGCGTKLSHNVVGLLGVCNGIDDDLRTGLPLQMTEVHDPVRLLVIIEQAPNVVLRVLEKNPSLLEWVKNDWVKLATIHPASCEIQEYVAGRGFLAIEDLETRVATFSSSQACYDGLRENVDVARIRVEP